MISFATSGSFDRTEASLKKMLSGDIFSGLDALAREGVIALATATPMETGLGAASWDYVIERSQGSCTITWTNSDVENGFPVVIMLQYGYGTGTGGYVQGRDFINPAIKPIFDQIADKVWKAVTSA
jgi:hypothetical protein